MADELWFDYETRSTADLRVVGAPAYARHPSTDLMCFAYAFNDGPVRSWWRTDGRLPMDVIEHFANGGKIHAHNSAFERYITRHVGVRYGLVEGPVDRWWDTAAEAAAMALPRKLEYLTGLLAPEYGKDMEGNKVMLQLTKPRETLDDGTVVWWDAEGVQTLGVAKGWKPKQIERELAKVADMERIVRHYCERDVEGERAVAKCIRPLSHYERQVYLRNQLSNDYGFRIDRSLVEGALRIVARATDSINAELDAITGGGVAKVTDVRGLKSWLASRGVETASVGKTAIAELLERDDLPDDVREALGSRLDGAKSSTKKLVQMVRSANPTTDRICDTQMYHGSSTGRDTGRGVQPHNFPRGEVETEPYIEIVRQGDYETLVALDLPPLTVVSSMMRNMLIPGDGAVFYVADFAAIECRVVNWLAGQDDVVDRFRGYDAAPTKAEKAKYDPYLFMANAMGRPGERQAGKAVELGCGFGMGPDKLVTASWDVYRVRIDPLLAKPTTDIYRDTHAKVKAFWYASFDAVKRAVRVPNTVHTFGANNCLSAVVTDYAGHPYLFVKLPSGRLLTYANPRLYKRPAPWSTPESPALVDALYIDAVNPKTGRWQTGQQIWYGLLVENIVQAVARDLMIAAEERLVRAGFVVPLKVHDELVAEGPPGYSVKAFEALVAETPPWAQGLPVSAEGWTGPRYKK